MYYLYYLPKSKTYYYLLFTANIMPADYQVTYGVWRQQAWMILSWFTQNSQDPLHIELIERMTVCDVIGYFPVHRFGSKTYAVATKETKTVIGFYSIKESSAHLE